MIKILFCSLSLMATCAFAESYKVCSRSQKSYSAAEEKARYKLTGARNQRDVAKKYAILQTATVSESAVEDERLLEWNVCFEISELDDQTLLPDQTNCSPHGWTPAAGLGLVAESILEHKPGFFPEGEIVPLSRSFVFAAESYDDVTALHGWQCLEKKEKSESSNLCGVASGSFGDALNNLDNELRQSKSVSQSPKALRLDISAARSILVPGKLDWRVCAIL